MQMTDQRLCGTVAIEEIGPQCSRDSRDGGSLLPGAGVGHDRREAASPNPGSWGAYEGSPGCGGAFVNKAHARICMHAPTCTRTRVHTHPCPHTRTHALARCGAWTHIPESRLEAPCEALGLEAGEPGCARRAPALVPVRAAGFALQSRGGCESLSLVAVLGGRRGKGSAGDAVMISWGSGLNL